MILVKGFGQLCNNILQYAHIYAFGREYGVKTFSMRFAYKYQYFPICKRWYHNPLFYVLAKLLIKLHLIPLLEDEHPEGATQQMQERTLVAYGGWHYRYPELFQKYKGEILQLFALSPEVQQEVSAWRKTLPEADITLGLHIRRGDYIRWQGGKYFFDDTVYQQKIQEFCALHPGKRVNVIICTNDPKLDLPSYQAVHPTTFRPKGSAIKDLALLASCDYLIGVKSTFSLWASVYRDLPLYWIMDKDKVIEATDFQHFDDLYMSV